MHLDALKYFLYIVEEKSISKAAKKAHISQSALSQMIHKLEEDLDQSLLIRSNRGVTLTSQGEIVLRYANHIIKNFDRMVSELEDFDANDRRITISGTSSLAAYSLPCMIYKIKKHFPEFRYDLVAKDVDGILMDLKDDMADFGFVDELVEDDELIYHKMGREEVVLIAKYDYKVNEEITLEELLSMELIMCTLNHKTCEKLEVALKPHGKKLDNLNVIFNADSLSAVKSSVLNGYGMAFVPYESIKHELYEKSVKLVDINDVDLDYDIYMVSRKPKEMSLSAKESRDYLLEIGRKSFC